MKRNDTLNRRGMVVIARDVLAQIRAKIYKPVRCSYIEMDATTMNKIDKLKTGKELQSLVCRINTCKVCAIGAATLSAIRKFDSIIPSQMRRSLGNRFDFDGIYLVAILEQYMTEKEIRLMEMAYEGTIMNYGSDAFELNDKRFIRAAYSCYNILEEASHLAWLKKNRLQKSTPQKQRKATRKSGYNEYCEAFALNKIFKHIIKHKGYFNSILFEKELQS